MSITLFSILIGSTIPVAIHVPTFFLVRRIASGDPMKMMKANVIGFLLRSLLYGVTVVAVVLTLEVHMVGLALTFFSVFVLLHLAEALYFRRLFLSLNSE